MRYVIIVLLVGAAIALGIAIGCGASATAPAPQVAAVPAGPTIALPAPATTGGMSLNEALLKRRSVRNFESRPLTTQQVSQLLWAAQGITDPATGHRAAPSAMARYPLTIYMFNAEGVFSYQPQGHQLVRLADRDRRAELAEGGQPSLRQAPVTFIFTGDPAKMGGRAPQMAASWVIVEVGHAAENLALEATALGLGTVTVGGVNGATVKKVLGLPESIVVVYAMPVGYPAAGR